MFVGWEGVGVSSYLLINFWFTRVQANKSAIKAMLLNRVGDFALLIAIFSIIFVFNSLDYDIIFTLTPFILDYRVLVINFQINIIDFISIFLFFGAMGKSAQIGLHTWLPDAMEGPTPVSALIHAATMVTAGVFLLSRCSYFLEFSPFCLDIIMLIGSFTAFFAATTGLFQNDMKKVIAYSTCSQLGYMVFSCGLSSYEVGLFHLFNHAFFKALLFLGAGSVIHAAGDEQDMRRLGGLKNILPFSYAIMVIGSLALMGFPFLAGFFSKDVILETSFSKYTITSHLCFLLGILSAFATSFYSVRLIYLVFLSNPNANRNVLLNSHESGWKITFPLFLLSLFSIFVGYFFKDFFIGFGTSYWGAAIFILPQNYLLPDVEFLDNKIKIMPFIVSFLGAFSSIYMYRFNIFYLFSWKMLYTFKLLYTFFNKKWFFDRFYNQLISQSSLKFGYFFSYKMVDRGVLEVFGPSGITLIIQRFRDFFKKFQSGYVFHYVSILVIFTLIFLLFSTKSIFLLIFLFLFLF
jgi:NADH-ubiquinone oxidoreductase chain 5